MTKLIWNITWIILHPLFRVFCRLESVNREVLKKVQPPAVIAVALHGARFDPWIVGAIFPFNSKFFPIYYVTAAKYMKIPFLGAVLRAYGAFPVEIGVGVENSLHLAVKLLQEGKTVGIFPEGSLSKANVLRNGKKGAAYLSQTVGVPVIPLVLTGTYKLTLLNFVLGRCKIKGVFGEPYLVREESLELATQTIMTKIRHLYVQH